MIHIKIKRIYDQANPDDGFRILVDRLWPRGLSKEKAKVDLWLKAVSPSTELRKWYHHDPEKWLEFKERYFFELASNRDVIDELLDQLKKGRTTFLFSSKEPNYNNAVALKDYLESISK